MEIWMRIIVVIVLLLIIIVGALIVNSNWLRNELYPEVEQSETGGKNGQ